MSYHISLVQILSHSPEDHFTHTSLLNLPYLLSYHLSQLMIFLLPKEIRKKSEDNFNLLSTLHASVYFPSVSTYSAFLPVTVDGSFLSKANLYTVNSMPPYHLQGVTQGIVLSLSCIIMFSCN